MKTTLTLLLLAALTGGAVAQGALKGTTLKLTGNATIAGSTTSAAFIGPLTGNVTGNVSGSAGSVSGNAATATALQTGRTINGTTFDGTGNITITAAAGTVTGTTLNSSVVTSSLTALGTIGTGAWNATAIGSAYGGTGIDASASTGFGKWASGTYSIESAGTHLTSIGGTTVGKNIFGLTNPSAIRFLRINADNSVDALDAGAFLTAIGAGSGSVATDTIFDAKGDLAVGTGADTAGKLSGVGVTNGWVLTYDSAETTGTKWAAVTGTGDVVGPGSSTNNHLAIFDSTTGKLLKDSSSITAASGALAGITTAASSGLHTNTQDALGGSTSTAGLLLQNTTAAAAGAQQNSPAVQWKGNAWKSNATAASQTIEFQAYMEGTQGTSAASGLWRLDRSLNGGGFANAFSVTTGGVITAPGAQLNFNAAATSKITGGTNVTVTGNSNDIAVFDGSTLALKPSSNGLGSIGESATRWGAGYFSTTVNSPIYGIRAVTGTNATGLAVSVDAGIGTGTGIAGAITTKTGITGTTGTTAHSQAIRGYVFAGEKTLTESTATIVFNVALATGKYVGGDLIVTTHADDATDFQAVTDHLTFSAVNKAGTVTASIQAAPSTSTAAVSAGTLTTTWTAAANGASLDIKNSAVSSLTQTTLKCTWQLRLNGDGTAAVTP